MMGHTIDVYHDIQMNGIDYLRNICRTSGLIIIPKTQTSKIDALKEIIRVWGLNLEEILTREAMSTPHRTVIYSQEQEKTQLKILCDALKTEIKKDITLNDSTNQYQFIKDGRSHHNSFLSGFVLLLWFS